MDLVSWPYGSHSPIAAVFLAFFAVFAAFANSLISYSKARPKLAAEFESDDREGIGAPHRPHDIRDHYSEPVVEPRGLIAGRLGIFPSLIDVWVRDMVHGAHLYPLVCMQA